MDTKTILATAATTLARSGLKYLAALLVGHGLLAGGNAEAFMGLGLALLSEAWSLWNSYGHVMAKAALDILRARVLAAAARANIGASPALELASVAAHADPAAAHGTYEPRPADDMTRPRVVVLLAAGLAALAMGWGAPAHAQVQPFRPTGNLPRDIAATRPAPAVTPSGAVNYDGLGAQFPTIVKDVIDKAIADLSAASKDAAGQNPPDLIAQPCWDAQIAFLKLLPAEWSEPPTNVGPALAIQIGRDLRRALTGDQRGTIKVDCAALFGDELAQITKLGSILGLKIATLGL